MRVPIASMSSLTVLLAAALAAGPARAVAEAARQPPLADDPTLVTLAVALACASSGEAAATPPGGAERAPEGPELELIATVRAKALRFDALPTADFLLPAPGQRGRLAWRVERVNLPARPEPGVVYRRVEVRLTLWGDLEELAAILHAAARASTGVRIEGDASAAVVPAWAHRPLEVAPPPPPAGPVPVAP